MRRSLWLLTSVAVLGLCSVRTQPVALVASPHLSNALTRVLRTDGTVTAGLFIGLTGDSVSLVVGGRMQNISRHEMLRLTMECRAEQGSATLCGLILGAYSGNLALLRDENQAYAFMKSRSNESPTINILISSGFAFVGAGLGYIVGSSGQSEESFDFAGSEEADQQEWERVRALASGSDRERVFHLSFQAAWVDTYLPNSEINSYGTPPSQASNFNLMRKMQLAITLTRFLDGGLAVMWVGQPFSPRPFYGPSSVTGRGYYALGILKPLASLAPRNLQWDVGVGVGGARVEYIVQGQRDHYPDPPRDFTMSIRKTLFSGMVYTEVKFFLSGYFSLGITGDYVFIPERIPEIQEMSIPSRQMGTGSIGFVLGLHF